nr:hypothetical protein [Bacillota bacterium]
MRNLWWLLVLLFLFGCKAHPEPAPTAPPSDQRSLREGLHQIVERQLARDPLSFSIILGEPSDLRFVGEQKGADWTLKSEGTDEPIEVTKKGDQIELVRSENRETLSERQFGLISPRDHLLLLREAAGRITTLPSREQGIEGMEIVLDREKIGKIVEKQMGSQKAAREIALSASRKIRVLYRLWYRSGDGELVRMEIRLDTIHPSPDRKKQIRYIFRTS